MLLQQLEVILIRTIQLYSLTIVVSALLTWYPKRTPFVEKTQALLDGFVAPYVNLFRRFIPIVNGLDFSTVLAILSLQLLQTVVRILL